MSERVAVAMSGGVDSSVAAHILTEGGHDVVGLTIRSPFHTSQHGIDDARRVADDLDIPLEVIDLSDGFADLMTYLCDEYLVGRTPNPCVRCNRLIKFGRLLEAARRLDCCAIATGHYVRRQLRGSRWALLRGAHAEKEQSYFLFELTQNQIEAARFPLGELTKPEVRHIATERGFHVVNRAESQEICMVPDDDYRTLLRQHCADRLVPGDIVDTAGKVLGRHEGIAFYTIGQRRGLGVAVGTPVYVVGLERATNRVILGPDEALHVQELTAEQVNWVAIEAPDQPRSARVQIRYRHSAAPAQLLPVDADAVRIVFDTPQRAVTPGQAAVFYDDDMLLGGGWIA